MQKWADDLKLMNGSGRHYITMMLSGATMDIWLKYTCVGYEVFQMKWVWCDVIVQLWPVFPLTLHVFFLPGTVTKYWARRSTRAWLSSCRSWFASKSECTKRIPPRRNPSAAWSWVSERSPSTWSCTRLSVSLFLPTVKRSRPKVQSLLHQRCLQWLQSCGTLSLGKIK